MLVSPYEIARDNKVAAPMTVLYHIQGVSSASLGKC